MSAPIDIRLMLPGDLPVLHQISRDAYSLNFGHHWLEGGLEEYVGKVYGAAALNRPSGTMSPSPTASLWPL